MSTLRVNTIQNVAGSGTPAINGLAQAWVNFNGTGTVAIRASFNVSSITDNGTGDYTANFTVAMSDANYAVAGQAGNGALQADATPNTVNGTRFAVVNRSSGVVDNEHVRVVVFR